MRAWFLLLGLLSIGAVGCQPEGEAVRLAAEGTPLMPIVVGERANESVRQSAERLRGILERITGAAFEIRTGNGTRGIAIGLPEDFPALREMAALPPADPRSSDFLAARQAYRLRSHPQGIILLGASELAVEYAVWDLLHRIGYRLFMPDEAWEIVPRLPDLAVEADALEKPAYFDRRLSGPCFRSPEWGVRNRLNLHGGAASHAAFLPTLPARWKNTFTHCTHAYSYIVRDNPDVFRAHPEWMALADGERGRSTFLCISQPGLRDFVAGQAVQYLEKYPDFWSVSLEPTDGDGWCQCADCAKLGKISNRPVLLANRAAEAVEQRFPGDYKRIGMLGYGRHWQPPDMRLHDRIVVLVTTKTLCAGPGNNPPMEERLAGWASKAATVGVYDYWSLHDWGGGLPGVPAAADIAYLARVIPRYHDMGARVWLAEAGDAWGPCGLGYYMAGRLLWNPREDADAIRRDFLDRSFGPAAGPMARFYAAIDGSHHAQPGNPNSVRARVAHMYPPLLEARAMASDPAIRNRIDPLLVYTRLAELNARYQVIALKRQAGLDGLDDAALREAALPYLRLAYRARGLGLMDWTRTAQTWLTKHALTIKDLDPDGTGAPDAWKAEVDSIAADASRPDVPSPPAPCIIRNGDMLLFNASGFEVTNGPVITLPEKGAGIADVSTEGGLDPAPLGGRKVLRLRRDEGEVLAQALFDRQTNGAVTVEWMAHGNPAGDGDNAMQFILKEGGRERLSLLTRITGDVMVLDEGRWRDTGADYDGLRWERWRIRYRPGESTFELDIGGRPAVTLPARPVAVDRFVIRAGSNGTVFYVDGTETAQPKEEDHER